MRQIPLAADGDHWRVREVACTLGAVTQETRYDSVGRITLRRASSERSHPLVFERRYQWDRQDLVVQQKLIENDNLTDGPQFQQRRFGYDARGQLTHSILPQREERFYYDPAGNRSDSPATTVWRNLLQRLNGHRWGYDGFGRLSWRRDGSTGVEQCFQYDAEHRLTAVTFDGDSRHQRAEYRYDALGRRTRKTLYPHHGEPQTTLFHWNGLQMVGEHNPDQPQRSTQYLYREDSYEPLARVDRHGDSSEVYWYHSELNGLPERMTDAQGKVVWHGRFSAWGATDAESGTLATQQNLRYQGQYLDRETGLHYNLFRYYDPNCGRFTQSDPIGLAGGVNTYAYTPDPISWVDPLGLMCSRHIKWSKKGWKHVYDRHFRKTSPRWSHKSKFDIGSEQNLKKIIEKTVRKGSVTHQEFGRVAYEHDFGKVIGSRINKQNRRD
ncbi:Cell wall-associated polypeptide CWBP200 [Serratia rubidaea]|uniref:Cell wall-associated polypeptide CWBP200 n=1 Tax=Serratia rubidaea TaxID=61652 RepID=A0A4U9HKB2_SERRU|nr:Cell wall-associated polypeptide CWBP200 [Serratia rubidaea]